MMNEVAAIERLVAEIAIDLKGEQWTIDTQKMLMDRQQQFRDELNAARYAALLADMERDTE